MVDTESIRTLALLFLGDKEVDVKQLDKYMYVLQKSGLELNYKFRLSINGVRSKGFSKYLEEKLSEGIVISQAGIFSCSSIGLPILEEFLITDYELSILNKVYDILSELSSDLIDLLVVSDLIITDIKATHGLQELLVRRAEVEETVSRISRGYSSENFNKVAGIISKLGM